MVLGLDIILLNKMSNKITSWDLIAIIWQLSSFLYASSIECLYDPSTIFAI